VGVLAQELRETIPSAVCETGDLNLNNGEKIENFLHVDKSRVYMECVGAVIELGKKAENFDGRIEKLEQHITQDDIIVSLDATSRKNDIDISDSLDLNKECEPKDDSSNQKVKKKKNKYGIVSLNFTNRFRECENTENNNSINSEDKKVKKAPCAPKWLKVIFGLILFAIVTGY
jgi:hypothetical protein